MNDLFESAQRILVERYVYEEKLRRYVTMRHDGLPRRDKTKAWQADGHSKTIDRAMAKVKPFWMGQIRSGDKLCNFTALTQQVQEISDSASEYYDFYTTNQTGFVREIRHALDHMLLKGRGILKSTIDPQNDYKIIDEAIDPMFLLMPESADNFDDAEEWIHLRQFTVAEWRRLDDRWDKSEGVIKQIRGRKDFQTIGVYQEQVRLREGITHTSNSNYILLFEHWVKTKSGHDIHYYSPQAPEIQLRKTHANPYRCGKKESNPFKSFQMEVKEKGWYAPRGLGELLDVQEQYETFIENKWADAMSISNTRIFTGAKEIQNMANIRLDDGQYVPGEISSVQFSPPPLPYTEMLQYQRARSEEISKAPDAGRTQVSGKSGGEPITAAENNRMAGLENVSVNDMSEIFREDLRKVHEHRWALICQFKDREFAYFSADQLKKLPEQALHDKYLIVPDGSPEGWNRGLRIQREIQFMQTFAGLPNSDPDYWVKRAMSAVDSQAALQGFRPQSLKGADEYQAQAEEILLLSAKPSLPVQPQPQQDQPTRIKCIIDWMQAASQMGVPVDPIAKMRVQQNLVQRLQILKQQNPSVAKEIEQSLAMMEQPQQQPQPI